VNDYIRVSNGGTIIKNDYSSLPDACLCIRLRLYASLRLVFPADKGVFNDKKLYLKSHSSLRKHLMPKNLNHTEKNLKAPEQNDN